MGNDSITTFRLPKELAERADRLVPALKETELGMAMRVTRSAVLRLAMAKGLAALEQEHGVEEDAVSAAGG